MDAKFTGLSFFHAFDATHDCLSMNDFRPNEYSGSDRLAFASGDWPSGRAARRDRRRSGCAYRIADAE